MAPRETQENKSTPRYAAPAVDWTLDIVEFLANQTRPYGINELSRELGITTNAVFRVLRRLTERGYVETTVDRGGYQLGTRFFSLGMRLYTRFELRNRAHPHLEELARITGETCQLHVPNGTGMLVIDVAHPAKDFFLQVVPGAHMNFHANAFGKAVLAFLPAKRTLKMLPKTLEPLTGQTLTTHEALQTELESVRNTGLAYDREEYVRGVHCIGAPVFSADGAAIAGLGTTGLAVHASGVPDAATATAVMACAEAVSKAIGYTGNRFDLWRRSGRKKKPDVVK